MPLIITPMKVSLWCLASPQREQWELPWPTRSARGSSGGPRLRSAFEMIGDVSGGALDGCVHKAMTLRFR